jgi:glutamate/tyrosine decarboxylase-like PLP-dependent enzyme
VKDWLTMTTRGDGYDKALERAATYAKEWLGTVGQRQVAPRSSADEIVQAFAGPLPGHGCDSAEVVDLLVTGAEPGLMAMGSGRFFGWVIGGTLPAALGADWLVSAWDQNAGLRYATPAAAAIEEVAAAWLLDLLGLPATASVGFVTGATMANFTGLASARDSVLAGAGWDVHLNGLTGGPRVHVLVGHERHVTVDLALRYLGLGRPTVVPADDQGRIRLDALAEALAQVPAGEPLVVCLQAGNVHSGAYDAFEGAISMVHERSGWVHVDGAFGLWAAAAPTLSRLVVGVADADSWATDAHKTLNVPYDCGIAIVASATAMRSAFSVQADYLIADQDGPGDPADRVPEVSRRARGVPVWAALRSLGREGVAGLVERMALRARAIAEGVSKIEGAEVLNEVEFTQVCVAFEDDERTRAVTQRLLADGTTWMSGSRWRDRDVVRISVSNWSTDEDDVALSVDALMQAATG